MNKLKYIFIDSDAAEDLASRRGMQSEEFDEGRLLGVSINDQNPVQRQLSPKTYVIPGANGIFILTAEGAHRDFIVIDLDAAPIFQNCSARESVTRFQKLLRFARRRWEKVSPSHSEMLLPGSSKGVLFPNPITTQSSLRITIELSPAKGSNCSGERGMEFLVYRIGTDEGGGVGEVASVQVFNLAKGELRKALTLLEAARTTSQSTPSQNRISSLKVSTLGEGTVRGSIEGLNFDQWSDYLTDKQREFIESELIAPYRIEGPAGTGKTLSLVLKCISHLRKAKAAGSEHRALFVAHSAATKRQIQAIFDAEEWLAPQANIMSLQSLQVTTLHELCSELLRYEISETELLDRDAYESKQSQLLYAVEALGEVVENDLGSHRAHMSSEFVEFLGASDSWNVAEMIQQEISVMIKGRAGFSLEKYKQLPRLSYGLPLKNDGDKAFIFLVFNSYQKRLKAGQQFDTDDVVLSTLQQLNTPIWRRRREKEGFDSIFVDETHLFNINELSTFHLLTRTNESFPIAYSADVSQSLGDRGWSDISFDDALLMDSSLSQINGQNQEFLSIFRCSPGIVDLAFSVTSSGAGLFLNFHDPLAAASSAFTSAEERKCSNPQYIFTASDDEMLERAFEVASQFNTDLQTSRGAVAIIVFGNELFAAAERLAKSNKKPFDVLKRRGDMDLVRRARSDGRFVLTMPEFVGGLEFDAAVLVGVDNGRVPPKATKDSADSDNFLSYATYQKLYVAITRAKYRIAILGVAAHGPSPALESAISNHLIERVS